MIQKIKGTMPRSDTQGP